MKKMFLSLGLALVLALSCVSVGFAAVAEDDTAQTYQTSSITTAMSRESGTYAQGSVCVNFARTMDSYTTTVYLQKLSNNNWVHDTSNEDYVKRATGTNTGNILFNVYYDDLAYGTSYRLKVVSKTVYNGVTYSREGYSAVF